MSDIRADYYGHLQEAGNRFARGAGSIGPMRELPGGGRVVAVLPAENYHHLRSHHGVSLSCADEVQWLHRHHPETAPQHDRKMGVFGAVGTGAARKTRFGRASFHKVYS